MPKIRKPKKQKLGGMKLGKKGKKGKKLKASGGGGLTAPSSKTGTQYKPAKGDRSHEDSTYKLQQSHFTRLAGDYNADRIRDLGEAGTYYGTLATPAQAAQYQNVTNKKLTGYKTTYKSSKNKSLLDDFRSLKKKGKSGAALRKLKKGHKGGLG